MREQIVASALLLGASVVTAEPSVTEFKLADRSAHSLSSALHIGGYEGQFAADEPFDTAELHIAFFKDGKLVPESPLGAFSSGWSRVTVPVTEGRVSVKYIDLDYLAIKEAPKNCVRFHWAISYGGAERSGDFDVGKGVFDLSKGAFFSPSKIRGNEKIKNVLFYEGRRSGPSPGYGADSLDELLRQNIGRMDFMVVYLSFPQDQEPDKPEVVDPQAPESDKPDVGGPQ